MLNEMSMCKFDCGCLPVKLLRTEKSLNAFKLKLAVYRAHKSHESWSDGTPGTHLFFVGFWKAAAIPRKKTPFQKALRLMMTKHCR